MAIELSIQPTNYLSGTAQTSHIFSALPQEQIADLLEDHAELDYLIDGIDRFTAWAQAECRLDWLPPRLLSVLGSLKEQQANRLNVLDQAKNALDAARADELNSLRASYLDSKIVTRDLYRQCGSVLCGSDWQSPIYAASVPMKLNRLTQGIAEHKWDYKRDGHLEALEYERNFLNEYVDHLGFDGKSSAYLTNCGMAAFTTVLHWLAHEQRFPGNVLALEPMYFENLHLASGFFPELTRVGPLNCEDLRERLQAEKPGIVLCDVVTNCNGVLAHDVETILAWAREESQLPVCIVIDTTCLPSVLLPQNLLKELPGNVTVILVESLAKYHQFGMDTVTGGIAILCGAEQLQLSFHKTRARLGTNITDMSVGCLPQPNRHQLVKRLHRHSRNLQNLIEKIESFVSTTAGAIERISWLRDGSSLAPDFHGTCFSVHLHDSLKSIDKYREFESTIVRLSEEHGLPVALSTSFGFDVTRLYVTAPATPFEPPFLRVSIGTETRPQLDCLIEIFKQAHVELGLRWRMKPAHKGAAVSTSAQTAAVLPLNESARSKHNALSRLPAASFKKALKPGIAHTVFTGESALKDYLSPANYPAMPLVELPPDLNPYISDGVRIFAKMVPLVPLMNIKSIPAFSMLQKAAERGQLKDISSLIESSSGNTVLSLSIMARLFGINSTYAIVDHSIAPSLLRMLRLFGIEVLKHPGPGHELYNFVSPRSERARQLAQQPGWVNPGQYTNPDNPAGFAEFLAPELWEQTQGKLSILSCGLGTCGTILGVSKALRACKPDLQVVACCPLPGHAIPGPREHSQLVDVAFPWRDMVNARIEMPAEEAFAASIKLLRRGIMGGPSSGMNYAGALRHLETLKRSGQLSGMVASAGEVWCAFLCCDSPLPHVDEYYDALGEEYFAAVHEYQHEVT